jgi:hypothetical protein
MLPHSSPPSLWDRVFDDEFFYSFEWDADGSLANSDARKFSLQEPRTNGTWLDVKNLCRFVHPQQSVSCLDILHVAS